jgi:hypothetical protein
MIHAVGRTCGSGQVEYVVDRSYLKRIADIQLLKLEMWTSKMLHISGAAGEQIVDHYHVMALG